MSTYEEAARELARIRRKFNLSPDRDFKAQNQAQTKHSNHNDDSFLSSDMPNHSLSRDPSPYRSGRKDSPPQKSSYFNVSTRTSIDEDKILSSGRKTLFFSGEVRPVSRAHRSVLDQANPPTTSVIEAFRELQGEVKVLEAERFEASRERDELKNRLQDSKRTLSLSKNRAEIETTETLLSIRAQNERASRHVDEAKARLRAQEEIVDSLQRKLQAQHHLITSLQADIARNEHQLINMEKGIQLLRREVHTITSRTSDVNEVAMSSPSMHKTQAERVHHTITALQKQIEKVNLSKMKLHTKLTSLRSYVDLVIKINGELCETLIAREAAKAEVLRLSRSLSPPPRYSWPKEVPYNNIVHIVNESAKATAEAAVEHAALKATEGAIKSVIKAMTPPRRRPVDEISSDDEEDIEDIKRRVNRSLDRLSRPLTAFSASSASKSPTRMRSRSPSLTNTNSRNRKNTASSISRVVTRSLNFDDYDDEDDEYDNNRLLHTTSTALSRAQSSQATGNRRKKMTRRRKTVKGNKRPSSAMGISNQTAATAHQTATTAILSNMLSGIRRDKSWKKVVTRQGAVTSATRLAAAATAATVAANSPSPPRIRPNTTMTQTVPIHGGPRAKIDFLPSSGTASHEFNIIAAVSKASRSTKELNATIASK